ncbi:hypothetical protein [Pedobacter sp. UBA5917]|jgi:hypothetical protein|uniref:hypothetical protein n=1 Tax=Pedobacter sp. UBA5917 TaxID=1947061 RepID=UPI0025D27A1C|nr:hypothetical protein [Pedobacter sp. UBA5917]
MKSKISSGFIYPTAIFVLIAYVYWPVIGFEFLIGWDDQWFVTNHYTQDGFSLKNLIAIFTEFYYGQYAPVNQLYYTLIYSIFGYSPGYYHILSAVIHCINCVLIYFFLYQLLYDIYSDNVPRNKMAAFISASLFAILPINVEPVSWIAASKVLIYAMFYLLALGFYRKYVKTGRQGFYYLVLICLLLSFGAKEQAVTMPIFLIILDYLYGRNMNNRLVWLEKLPIIILSVLMGVATLDSQQVDSREFYSLIQRVPLFFYSVTEYFTKILFPVNLSYLYPFPFEKTDNVPVWMWVHTIFIPLIVILLWRYLKNKIWLFCISFFFIHIVLVSNAVSLARFSVIADRYGYLSSIGLCLLITLLFLKISEAGRVVSVFATILGGIYFFFLIGTAQSYVLVWRDASKLKERLKHTIELRSDYKTYNR